MEKVEFVIGADMCGQPIVFTLYPTVITLNHKR